jgi:hypothetical protein
MGTCPTATHRLFLHYFVTRVPAVGQSSLGRTPCRYPTAPCPFDVRPRSTASFRAPTLEGLGDSQGASDLAVRHPRRRDDHETVENPSSCRMAD